LVARETAFKSSKRSAATIISLPRWIGEREQN
jgi:hypothetical protein